MIFVIYGNNYCEDLRLFIEFRELYLIILAIENLITFIYNYIRVLCLNYR